MSFLNLFKLNRCGAEFLVTSQAGVVIKVRHCTKSAGHMRSPVPADRHCSDGEAIWTSYLSPSKRWD